MSTVKRDLFAHMQRLSLEFHRRTSSGELLTRLVKDVTEIKGALTDSALETASECLLLLCMVGVLVALDRGLALWSAAIFPALFWCVWHYSTGIRHATRRQRDKESRSTSIFAESLAAIAVVQSFAKAGQTTARFDRESQKGVQADLVATRLKGRMNRWVEVIVAAGTCLVLYLGAPTRDDWRPHTGRSRRLFGLPAGDVQAGPPDRGQRPAVLSRDRGRGARGGDPGHEPQVADRPGARVAPSFAGRVTFDPSGFAYEAGRPILDAV